MTKAAQWSHLCIGQHDVLDEGQAPRLAVLHAHVVDLVAADLTVLLAGYQGPPHHLYGRGVKNLHLHAPGRSPGNCGRSNTRSGIAL